MQNYRSGILRTGFAVFPVIERPMEVEPLPPSPKENTKAVPGWGQPWRTFGKMVLCRATGTQQEMVLVGTLGRLLGGVGIGRRHYEVVGREGLTS